MRHFIYIIFFFIFISNCTLNKVTKHHGVHFLEKKYVKLKDGTSNKNDIIKLLGPPSTKGTFDDDLWIYIEITTSSSKLLDVGKKILITNNVLILDINKKGILTSKIFMDKEKMNKLEFSKEITQMSYSKNAFIYEFLNSVRQKINDPLNKKGLK